MDSRRADPATANTAQAEEEWFEQEWFKRIDLRTLRAWCSTIQCMPSVAGTNPQRHTFITEYASLRWKGDTHPCRTDRGMNEYPSTRNLQATKDSGQMIDASIH